MKRESVTFPSHGQTLKGELRSPDEGSPPFPTIVQAPGWLGIAGTKSYAPYHDAFVAAGFATLLFDYRGFGRSAPLATRIDPNEQVEDWLNALTFARSHPLVDAARIGIFGSGGTGGGNALVVAARDEAAKAVVAQVPIADGKDWLRRMRSEEEWRDFIEALEADRTGRDVDRPPTMVPARGGLTVSPNAPRAGWKEDVVEGVPHLVELSSAEALFAYRPIDSASEIAPRACMIVAVEDDDVTPTEHAQHLYDAAGPPKKLILLRGTTHYSAYADFRPQVVPAMVEWFDTYVKGATGVAESAELIVLEKS